MNRIIEYVLSIPKSLYVNFRMLPIFQALKMPIIVRHNAILKSLKGRVILPAHVGGGRKTALVRIGFTNVGIIDTKCQRTLLQINGRVTVNGRVNIGAGSKISVADGGVLTFGKRFVNTAAMTICCEKSVSFGDDVLISWGTTFIDTDYHQTYNTLTGNRTSEKGDIIIENDVWVGMNTTILKNTTIPNGCIIGANSLVNKIFKEENVLIAGNPGKILKKNVSRLKLNRDDK